MKNVFFLVATVVAFVACGEKAEEILKLETQKDKLSYAMGADFASPIVQAGKEAEILDFEMVAKGFEAGLNDNDYEDCQQVMIDAFGKGFINPDSTKRKPGSDCFGKLNGSRFYQIMKEIGELDQFDMKLVARGFKDALMKSDTILDQNERVKILEDFKVKVEAKQREKLTAMDKPFMDKAKALPNTRVIDGGIVIETLKEGTGGSPNMQDDVDAHYIVTTVQGDTMDQSFKRGESYKTSLQAVIPGWTMAFPNLKKGGKYNIYIPSDLGYGNGALKFYIEFINYGPAGTLAAPRQPQGGM